MQFGVGVGVGVGVGPFWLANVHLLHVILVGLPSMAFWVWQGVAWCHKLCSLFWESSVESRPIGAGFYLVARMAWHGTLCNHCAVLHLIAAHKMASSSIASVHSFMQTIPPSGCCSKPPHS